MAGQRGNEAHEMGTRPHWHSCRYGGEERERAHPSKECERVRTDGKKEEGDLGGKKLEGRKMLTSNPCLF
jgi:hypothetical protein